MAAQLPTPRVLVVDDSPAIRRMVRAMFEGANYEVDCVESGEEAFDRALGRPFDAIITDVTMGDVSGIQLCRILRSDPATAATPIVMLTAMDSPYDRFCARHAGADAYVTKRSAGEALVETVEGLVDRDALRSSARPPRPPDAPDAARRLSQVLEEHLFRTLVSSEIRGFARHSRSRRELGLAVLRLCSELMDYSYAVLELQGPDGRSFAVHPRGPFVQDTHVGLESLGLAVGAKDAVDRFEDEGVPGDVVAGARHHCPIESGRDRLGSLTVFGGARELDRRTLAFAEHIAAELSVVVHSVVLVEQMRHMAQTDPLTGLANRRRCVERLEHELARALRTDRPLCLVLCDIDHFKAVNDTHGHNVGDDVLRAVARELDGRVRSVDLVGRWGGEEFLVLLPEASAEGGRLVAERLRLAVASMTLDGPVDRITLSAGVVCCDPERPPTELVDRADQCLYEAKEKGRNCVVVWTEA